MDTDRVIAMLSEVVAMVESEAERMSRNERCYVVLKWVLNKVKKKYYYYYLHCYDSGRTRSIYLGKSPSAPATTAINFSRLARTLRKAAKHIRSAIALLESVRTELEASRALLEMGESGSG